MPTGPKRRNQAKAANKRRKKSLNPNQASTRIHHKHRWGVSRIKSLAEDLKIQFQIIKNHKNAVDPQVLYFLPAEADRSFNVEEIDDYKGGNLFHQWAFYGVEWGCTCNCPHVVSIAALRKWIENPHLVNIECIVCMEDVTVDNYSVCPGCHSVMCCFCHVQCTLNEQGLRAIHSNQNRCNAVPCLCHLREVRFRCVQCRKEYKTDLMKLYFKFIDRLDEFNPEQTRILRELCKHDQRYPAIRDSFVETHSIKAGVSVVLHLHGLSKEEWNGKVAEITGRHVDTEQVRRWPIKMKDGSGNTALVKEPNMKMFNCPALRMITF